MVYGIVFSTLCCISMLVELAHHQKLSMVHLHVGLSKNPLVEGWQSSQRSENLQWRSSIPYSLDLRVSRCQFLTLLHVLEFCLQPGETRICGGYAHIYIYTHTYLHTHTIYIYCWMALHFTHYLKSSDWKRQVNLATIKIDSSFIITMLTRCSHLLTIVALPAQIASATWWFFGFFWCGNPPKWLSNTREHDDKQVCFFLEGTLLWNTTLYPGLISTEVVISCQSYRVYTPLGTNEATATGRLSRLAPSHSP